MQVSTLCVVYKVHNKHYLNLNPCTLEKRKRKHCYVHFSLHFNRAELNKHEVTATTTLLLQANHFENQ